MIKRIITAHDRVHDSMAGRPRWLELDDMADVDVSSEEPDAPVEGVFAIAAPARWRAGSAGPQIIRLRFRRPVHLTRIGVAFEETTHMRTQEFVLRWRAPGAASDAEIVRQQFTFAPPNSTHEHEEYAVDLEHCLALELIIIPDISGGDSRATLERLCLA